MKKLENLLNLIGENVLLATASFGHGITTTLLQLAKAYSIIVNGGYNIKPTLIKKNKNLKKKKILNKDVSKKFYQF